MKLKKLEISGFKSFVEKTCIEFPPGISAVVGPNGCGKSNVVDAIKWVMGEQSVKQLRGKSMEDVIFSGTNGKQALNMAEVSLGGILNPCKRQRQCSRRTEGLYRNHVNQAPLPVRRKRLLYQQAVLPA